jgi:single-strand DNA-binding protein
MLNQTVLVGRLTKDPEVATKENGKKLSSIILAVQRPYKNTEGLYDTDFIKCTLWNGIAENTCEYCHTGDVVGIKGRLQSDSYQDETGKTIYVTEVVAERVTFLTSKKEESK